MTTIHDVQHNSWSPSLTFRIDKSQLTMSLYFDCAINSGSSSGNIHVNTSWHSHHPLLAVGSYSEEKGGYVTVYTDDGEPADHVTIPAHPTAQVTTTAWHPNKKMLAIGWETGELYLYSDHNNSCVELQTIHTSSIVILEWSQAGSRLISGDGSGSVVGWAVVVTVVAGALVTGLLRTPDSLGWNLFSLLGSLTPRKLSFTGSSSSTSLASTG